VCIICRYVECLFVIDVVFMYVCMYVCMYVYVCVLWYLLAFMMLSFKFYVSDLYDGFIHMFLASYFSVMSCFEVQAKLLLAKKYASFNKEALHFPTPVASKDMD
jgi:hypothetical protein